MGPDIFEYYGSCSQIKMFYLPGREAAFIMLSVVGPFGNICHSLPVISVAEIKSREKPKGQASVGV